MRRGRRNSLFDHRPHLILHEGNAMNRASTLALVLLAFSGAAPAKDLVGVFEDAVHNDPVIRQADANRLAAREARPQALAALLPQLSGTAGISGAHSAGYQDQVFQPPTAERFQITTDTNTRQWAVNLRQNVFSWANWMALKEAGREVAQAEATYQAAEQQLILRVAQAYFNVLAAEDGLEANQASLEAISRQLDQANKRFEVGLIAITDVQEAKAARDTAAAAVIAAKRTLATSEDQPHRQQAQRPPDRTAAHRAFVRGRPDSVEGASDPVPVDRRQGSGRAELTRHRASGARRLPRRDQRHRTGAGAAPGARVESDGAQSHRGGLRGRHPHGGRRPQLAQDPGAGEDRLLRQPLRLHRERAAAAPGGR